MTVSFADSELLTQWHDLAGRISFYFSDHRGVDWDKAAPLIAKAKEVERQIKARGLPRPDGAYLLGPNDRIAWDDE